MPELIFSLGALLAPAAFAFFVVRLLGAKAQKRIQAFQDNRANELRLVELELRALEARGKSRTASEDEDYSRLINQRNQLIA